jgi:hypothetical protein
MMAAMISRINSLKRCARAASSVIFRVLTGMAMRRQQPVGFEAAGPWVTQAGSSGLGQSYAGIFTGMMATQNNWPEGS